MGKHSLRNEQAESLKKEVAWLNEQLLNDADLRKEYAQKAIMGGKKMKLKFYQTDDNFLNNEVTVQVWFE